MRKKVLAFKIRKVYFNMHAWTTRWFKIGIGFKIGRLDSIFFTKKRIRYVDVVLEVPFLSLKIDVNWCVK